MSNYVARTGYRMPLHLDGTIILLRTTTGDILQVPQVGVESIVSNDSRALVFDTSMQGVNTNVVTYIPPSMWLLFPQPRHIYGIFMAGGLYAATGYSFGDIFTEFQHTGLSVRTSRDSTNGIDGVWAGSAQFKGSNLGEPVFSNSAVQASDTYVGTNPTPRRQSYPTGPNWRRSAVPFVGDLSYVTGLRFDLDNFASIRLADRPSYLGWHTIQMLHLYGANSSDASDALEPWHPVNDEPLFMSDVDWGDVRQGSSAARTLRFKNRSASLTANGVIASFDTHVDASPSLLDQFALSLDGSTWTPTVSLGAIAPGAISPVVHFHRSTRIDAALSVWETHVIATVGSWT